MPPYFFRTTPENASKIQDRSPEGSTKIYGITESQDWMRGAMDDSGVSTLSPIHRASIDFLANEVVEASLNGGTLMHVEADSRDSLQAMAEAAQVEIQPLN